MKELQKIHVLVVDDDNKYLNLIASMLRRIGIVNILSAQNGEQALDILATFGQTESVDLILCDYVMPDMNGLELLHEVRRKKSTLPFVMITGSTSEETIHSAKTFEVTALLAKPFTLADLRKKLISALRTSSNNKIPPDIDWVDI